MAGPLACPAGPWSAAPVLAGGVKPAAAHGARSEARRRSGAKCKIGQPHVPPVQRHGAGFARKITKQPRLFGQLCKIDAVRVCMTETLPEF